MPGMAAREPLHAKPPTYYNAMRQQCSAAVLGAARRKSADRREQWANKYLVGADHIRSEVTDHHASRRDPAASAIFLTASPISPTISSNVHVPAAGRPMNTTDMPSGRLFLTMR